MATFGPVSIAANNDDYDHTSNNFFTDDAELRVGKFGSGNTAHLGCRWDNVSIPKGSTVTSAVIDFVSDDGKTVGGGGTCNSKISAVDEDDAARATSDATCDTDDGNRTSAQVDWDFTIVDADGTGFQTADFASVVQEILDRPGWASGQAMLFHIDDDGSSAGNLQSFAALNHATLTEPKITIVYTPPGLVGYWGLRVA